MGNLQIIDTQKAANLVEPDRHLDFMQQHTGQHIISAAFYHIGRYSTISVHQGTEYTTIEFQASHIPGYEKSFVNKNANAHMSSLKRRYPHKPGECSQFISEARI